ncbi:DNA mismatch repair protein MutS MSH4 [Gracilaria domingensis]|nr:DNA mismatch repair protein MutS MSH4 [Gracilaria domingensis]
MSLPQSSEGSAPRSPPFDLERFLPSRSRTTRASPVLRKSTARVDPLRIATARTNTARTGTARRGISRIRTGRNRSARTRDTNRTTSTRTGTARTRTQTARREDTYVVAIIDNTVREVGLCAYDLNGFVVELRQFTDSNLYTTLIKMLCILSPVEILLSTSSMGGLLVQAIQNSPHVSHIKLTYIGRAFFNETYGDLAVEKLSSQKCPHLSRLGSALYLSLACCGALLKYIEHVEDRVFAPSSLRIHFKPNDDTLFIDISALEGLEVIENVNAVAVISELPQNICLLRMMDQTITRAGKRFLRRAVLEPCGDMGTISVRQDVVEELINTETVYHSIIAALRRFPDLERAMAILMSRENARLRSLGTVYEPELRLSDGSDIEAEPAPEQEESAFVQTGPPSPVLIRTILDIKAALEAVTELLGVTEGLEAPLLRGIAGSMRSPALAELREEIDDIIDPDVFPSKDHERMRMNGALGVKHGRNVSLLLATLIGYLDIHRKIMGENIEDMENLADELRKKHGLHKLELTLHLRTGYHFVIPKKSLGERSLPEEFILINSGKKLHHFTSQHMQRLNVLYKNSMDEIWRRSELELGILVSKIFQPSTLTAIHRLCDCIAILDCLSSFVTYSMECGVHNERPTMTENGPIDLREAYHPVSLRYASKKPVPNDAFLDETSALYIISGRNMAGKTFYIKTVGLIVIMAHTGCWVPAKHASIRILKRIATRFETGYDITRNQSSFSKEMQDVAAIFDSRFSHRDPEKALQALSFMSHSSGPQAKGRYTSTVDGFSIAYAVLEELAAIPNTLTLCTTHFLGLGALAHVNPVVRTSHLVTERSDEGAQEEGNDPGAVVDNLNYTYKVSTGALPETSYGMETARFAGIPESLLRRCEELKQITPSRRISTVDGVLDGILALDKNDKNLLRKSIQTVSIASRIREIQRYSANVEQEKKLLAAYQKELLEKGKKNRAAKKERQKSRDGQTGMQTPDLGSVKEK